MISPTNELDKNGNLITHPAGPQTGHPTHLYDASVHDDRIVVMFATKAAAQAALDRLAAEGLAGDAAVTDRTADGANAGVNTEGGDTGLLGSIKGLFAPADAAHGLVEGVRRGEALLELHPALDSRDRVIEILAASDPIDFDAKLEHWRTDGWRNLAQQEAATTEGQAAPAPSGDKLG